MTKTKDNTKTPRDVWVFPEYFGGSLTIPSLELLSAGRKVADEINQRLVAVLIGSDLTEVSHEVSKYGVDEVICCEDEKLRYYNCLPFSTIIARLALKRKPYAFLFVADELGRDLVPRIAYRLRTGLATDTIDVTVGDYYHPPSKTNFKNILIQVRPDFSTRIAKIFTPSRRPQIATIRPGNFPLPEMVSSPSKFTNSRVNTIQSDFSVIVNEMHKVAQSTSNIEHAQAVIAIGLGILRDGGGNPRRPKEGYDLALKLASEVSQKYGWKTAVGSTRALIYAGVKDLEGLLSDDDQIGQTGRTVSPDVYFALGISGAIQHQVGMHKSKKIVAINIDKDAPIFRIAHYPILGDLFEEVPRLIEAMRGS